MSESKLYPGYPGIRRSFTQNRERQFTALSNFL
ncbi:hypothetical protein NIASO_07755 [Niabella soli DSM 19437]|uniref:Uncharacterized protein n=1 Tax=Niabella soli DSM 19437 TaxID=929713 RepID=W0F7L0_9BACT|nr:hypothetical protein NIASO_07755 [Niabella soli DSM 19437]